MGGALWWLLAAAVSGSWLMLLALVLSLAAWAVFPAAVCGGWVSQSRDRKKKTLVRLGLAVLLLLILRFGGQLLLGLAGLSWRRWVKSALDLGLLGAASVLAAKTAGRLIDDPARPGLAEVVLGPVGRTDHLQRGGLGGDEAAVDRSGGPRDPVGGTEGGGRICGGIP